MDDIVTNSERFGPGGFSAYSHGWVESDIPKPLRITKRSAQQRQVRVSRDSRCCSSESDASDIRTEEDSPEERPGGEGSLKMPKRKATRCGPADSWPVGCDFHRRTSGQNADGLPSDPPEPCRIEALCLRPSVHAAKLLVPCADSQYQRSTTSRESRRIISNDRSRLHESFQLESPSLSLAAQGRIWDGPANHHSSSRGVSPTVNATAEKRSKPLFSPRNGRSHCPPGPSSDAGTRSVTAPEFVSAGPRSQGCSPYEQCIADPFVLVPQIIVTPEQCALGEGLTTLWAAVQLSTQLYRTGATGKHATYATLATHGNESSLPGNPRYRYLYDVSVEILPTNRSTIIEVLDGTAYSESERTMLYPGSRILLVVHAKLPPEDRGHKHGYARQSSDDIMEELENYLSGTMMEFLKVRVTYRHCGFLQKSTRVETALDDFPTHQGVPSLQTTVQTTATATIMRYDSGSPWSPRCHTPEPNPLLKIVTAHWGIKSAREVMQRVATSKHIPCKKTSAIPPPTVLLPSAASVVFNNGHREESFEKRDWKQTPRMEVASQHSPIRAARGAPPVPKRRASLKQASTSSPWLDYPTGTIPEPDVQRCTSLDRAKMNRLQKRRGSRGDMAAALACRISFRMSKARDASPTSRTASSSVKRPASWPPTTPPSPVQ